MHELAYNVNGELFTPHESAVNWGARKMKERGAPEVAYGRNGLPAQVPIDATHETLRNVLTEPGRYRLDPMDEHGRRIEGAQPAYIHVPSVATVAAESKPAAIVIPERDVIVAEAIRHNTELARAVVDRFPEMMHAAAELLRAADGAGLPARVAPVPSATVTTDDQDDEQEAPARSALAEMLGIDLNKIITDVANNVVAKLTSSLPSLADMTDWGDTRKAKTAAPTSSPVAAPTTSTAHVATHATATAAPAASSDAIQPDANQMRQLMAIYTQLSTAEAKLARHLIQELTPAERAQWLADLSGLPVPEAVAKIRAVLGTEAKSGAVS